MTAPTPPPYRFKFGMFLNELRLPFEEALAAARDIGADAVWFDHLEGWPELAELGEAQVERVGDTLGRYGLQVFLLSPRSPFKFLHLTDLQLDTLPDHPIVRKERGELVRAMRMAHRLNAGAVLAYTCAWPGEYTAAKPTWPMRWLTRGGVMSDLDLDKLTRLLALSLEDAERHDVDLVLAMMPWNYTNTTSNFRIVAERLGSKRLKVMWGPADNFNCGEWDVATTGLTNVRPYLHSLHLKDLHVIDGLHLKFEYRPIGTGDVDYRQILRSLRDHGSQAILSVATHFLPPSGSRVEAMRTNFANLQALIDALP